MMKNMRQHAFCIFLCLSLCVSMTACDFLKKKVPPNEMFKTAKKQHESGNLLEAAKEYDQLIKQHKDSELVPAALYYSGICKYSLSVRSPGEKEFKERKGGLSEAKRELYAQWIDYMNKYGDDFLYAEAIDKYLYRGNEFKTLLDNYPSNNLVDDADFQLVRTHLLAKQSTNTLTIEIALQLYGDYFGKYPQSPYRPKGLEHLLQLASKHPETMLNHEGIVSAYQDLVRAAENMPDLARLSYLLGTKFLEAGDKENAASILGVPSVLGFGSVETQRTRLNIRSGQGTKYRIVAKADKGEQVLLLEKSGQWYNVRLPDGTVGYAHSDFIKTD